METFKVIGTVVNPDTNEYMLVLDATYTYTTNDGLSIIKLVMGGVHMWSSYNAEYRILPIEYFDTHIEVTGLWECDEILHSVKNAHKNIVNDIVTANVA